MERAGDENRKEKGKEGSEDGSVPEMERGDRSRNRNDGERQKRRFTWGRAKLQRG